MQPLTDLHYACACTFSAGAFMILWFHMYISLTGAFLLGMLWSWKTLKSQIIIWLEDWLQLKGMKWALLMKKMSLLFLKKISAGCCLTMKLWSPRYMPFLIENFIIKFLQNFWYIYLITLDRSIFIPFLIENELFYSFKSFWYIYLMNIGEIFFFLQNHVPFSWLIFQQSKSSLWN